MAEMAFLYIVLLILPFLVPRPTITADLNSDRKALLDFASAVPHARKLNWRNTSYVCKSWVGITCTPDGTRVMALRLPRFGLTGPIPYNTLGHLNGLHTLSLRSNYLNGNLPSDVLSLRSLRYINIQHNNFSGDILSSFSSQLNVIDFSFNSLTGEFPETFQNLTHLAALYLQNNSLSGPIPDLDLPNLKQFNISNNNLNGSIPPHLRRFLADSFSGNSLLCGGPLIDCPSISPAPSPSPSPSLSQTFFQPSSPSPRPGQFLPVFPQMQGDGRRIINMGTMVAIVIGGMAFLVAVALVVLVCCARRKRSSKCRLVKGKTIERETLKDDFSNGIQESENNNLVFFQGSSYYFNLDDLLRAPAEVIGKGSYGTTYAAIIGEGSEVVVKRLRVVVAGKREFEQQMNVIGRLSYHPNVVPLVAYYYSTDEKLLVYDHISGASLSTILYGYGDNEDGRILDWELRVKILLGAAKGVAHIHSDKLTHGNIKSSNVLISQNLSARIVDFGLTSLMGTPSRSVGYQAPEEVDTGKSTPKSDVYGFGVLLLELLTGKTPTEDEAFDLPLWVQLVVREEWTAKVFDANLIRYHQKVKDGMVQMLQIGMACVTQVPERRPTMDDIVNMIEEIHLLDSENQPVSEKSRSTRPTL